MNLDCLVKALVDAGIGQAGMSPTSQLTPIFKNRMGADVMSGIMFKTPLHGIKFDGDLPGFYKTSLQVIVRAPKQADGDALCKQVIDALASERRREYADAAGNTMTVNHLRLQTLPIVYLRDDSGDLEWSVNFDICYVMALL